MRRFLNVLPTVALTLGAVTLLWLGFDLRPDDAAERDRQSRSAYVDDIRGRERKVSATKMAATLRSAVAAERQGAERRERASLVALIMGGVVLAGALSAVAPRLMPLVRRSPAALRRPAALRVG